MRAKNIAQSAGRPGARSAAARPVALAAAVLTLAACVEPVSVGAGTARLGDRRAPDLPYQMDALVGVAGNADGGGE